MTGPLLTCRGVDAGYGPVQVLFDVDLDVREGEIFAVLGANGAGKSTLLQTIAGAISPTAGSVHVDGRDLTGCRPADATSVGVALVAGGSTTFPSLTVAEHFRVGTWSLQGDVGGDEIDRRTHEVLELFPRLERRWGVRGGDLSGGEQQQLALALAFVLRPRLLMVDELSLGLAPIVVAQLLESVEELHRRGATVLIVEQSVHVALEVADRACLMEKGAIRFTGTTAELREHPEILRQEIFHVGAELRSPSAGPSDRAGEVGLSVRGLTRRFGGISAVDEVSFEARTGEVLGLIGPNGAGKTTVFDLISGFLVPDRGRIDLDGVDIARWAPHRRAMAGLGRSFQDSRVFPHLTVEQNVALGFDRHLDHRDQLAALLHLPAVQAVEDELDGRVGELLERFRLEEYAEVPAGELPTGVRRLVDLAMVVALEPTVVMLDEPSSGVAPQETGRIEAVVRELAASGTCAVLVIEHDMGLLSRVSDSLLAMDQGAVVTQGSPEDVLNDPRIVEIYLGTALDAR